MDVLFLPFSCCADAMNIYVKFVCGHMFHFFCRYRSGITGHVITLCLTFWETTRLFSKVAPPFNFLTSTVFKESQFLHMLANFCSPFYCNYPSRCTYLIVVLVCVFLVDLFLSDTLFLKDFLPQIVISQKAIRFIWHYEIETLATSFSCFNINLLFMIICMR